MERRELGRSGVEIPAVGLGTWQVLEVRGHEAGQGPRRRRDALLVRGFSDLMSVMRRGWVDLVQVPYDAAKTAVAEELLPLAQELGLGVIVTYPSEYKPPRAKVPCPGYRGATRSDVRSDLRVG